MQWYRFFLSAGTVLCYDDIACYSRYYDDNLCSRCFEVYAILQPPELAKFKAQVIIIVKCYKLIAYIITNRYRNVATSYYHATIIS